MNINLLVHTKQFYQVQTKYLTKQAFDKMHKYDTTPTKPKHKPTKHKQNKRNKTPPFLYSDSKRYSV